MGVRKSSEIITLAHEDILFRSGTLGEDTPLKLLRTVIYMIGMHCALRGGIEHNNLRRPKCNSQIRVERDSRDVEHLVYKEDPLQKTNQGGLLNKNHNKEVFVYGSSNINRCPVRLFQKYCGLMPESIRCRKLYLRPRKNFNAKVWYCDQPYGVNRIKTTVKTICEEAGIEVHFTNHSLRTSCASRMFANHVPRTNN